MFPLKFESVRINASLHSWNEKFLIIWLHFVGVFLQKTLPETWFTNFTSLPITYIMVARKATQPVHSIISNTLRFKFGSVETIWYFFCKRTAQIITFESFPTFLKFTKYLIDSNQLYSKRTLNSVKWSNNRKLSTFGSSLR